MHNLAEGAQRWPWDCVPHFHRKIPGSTPLLPVVSSSLSKFRASPSSSLQETGRTEWKDRAGNDSSGSWTVGRGSRVWVRLSFVTLGDVPKFLAPQFPLCGARPPPPEGRVGPSAGSRCPSFPPRPERPEPILLALRRVTPAERSARHPLRRRPPISQQLFKARVPSP